MRSSKRAAAGRAVFKAVRGEYGSGKTFFARWLQERAKRAGFAASEVQISETETPLHRLETVYRRLIERLSTSDTPQGACAAFSTAGSTRWRRTCSRKAGSTKRTRPGLLASTNALMEQRLAAINRHAPAFSAALRAYRQASPTAMSRPRTASWPGFRGAQRRGRAKALSPASRATLTTSAR